jgi:phosphoribosyl 1,2-cyclic phosphate phosphodiesterase
MIRDVRFILLGSGTSGGVPVIACDCASCTSADPHDSRTRQGACIQWVDPSGIARTVLIDTTPDLRAQALRHDLRRCDAILYTHNHVDHIFGLDEVRRFNIVMKGPIDIYAERSTLDSLHRVYRHIFDKAANINDSFVATLIATEIHAEQPVDLFGMRFTPIRLLHGRQPILGFRIDPISDSPVGRASSPSPPLPLAYCTDVSAIPTETWHYLSGLDTLFLDGLRHKKHPTHFSLDQAVAAAAEIGARQTYFVHIAHEILHERDDALLPEGMHLGFDGLTLGHPVAPRGDADAVDTRAARFIED